MGFAAGRCRVGETSSGLSGRRKCIRANAGGAYLHRGWLDSASYRTALLSAAALIARFRDKFQQPEIRTRLIGMRYCGGGDVHFLFNNVATKGWEASWYRISDMMTHPEKVPVFGQRLLMIWPAMLLKHLVPETQLHSIFSLSFRGSGLCWPFMSLANGRPYSWEGVS